MGLLDGTTQSAYYQGGEKGVYQFTSLEDIINQFLVAYVGEEKIISKASRTDVAFHAQRAMQELSFDTFKSIKSQEITLPPSNTMILPHDYVNYTKISWSDSAGIKHLLYPTSSTSNPFKILQEEDGGYDFTIDVSGIFENGDFSTSLADSSWNKSPNHGSIYLSNPQQNISIQNERLEFKHVAQVMGSGDITGRHYAAWQQIDTSEIDYISLSAKGLSSAADVVNGKTKGTVRIGLSTQVDITAQDGGLNEGYNPNKTNPFASAVNGISKSMDTDIYDIPLLDGGVNYIEFNAGDDTLSAATGLSDFNVTGIDVVFVLIVSSGGDFNSNATTGTTSAPNAGSNTEGLNAIDDIVLTFENDSKYLQPGGESTTWSNYKSNTPSENQDSYDDDYYVNALGQRYGLNPQHAQVNGSFYIDNLRGLINFSSNVSGKTVILDYISDSLGTDGEMQVHKFAEEAMYKWIMYAILSTRANTPEYIVRRYQKEKFAATRQAKLRLSNIKLEEITQIFRGKSKHIKH